MGALDTALSSIPFGVCAFRFPRQPQALFKTALRIPKREGFPESLFCSFFLIQPGVPTDNPNDNETTTKK